jgi:hypothetical protein
MTNSTVQSLIEAVRRRMWRSEFVAAARLALWVTAGLMLVAVAVHLAVQPVRVGVVLPVIAVLWTSMMIPAGLRRPSDSSCALWADRHLGGASAFSTLLETSDGTQRVPQPQGLPWLEYWATARVPHSLRLLEERRDSTRLSRPLLSMLVCTAFATLVLTLPDLAPSSRQALATSAPSSVVDRAMPEAEPPVTTKLVGELAQALRSTESHRTSDGREVGRAPAEGTGKSNDRHESGMSQPGSATPGETAIVGKSPGGKSVDAAPTTGVSPASSTSSGRAAGDIHDDRADAGTSRVPWGTMAMERRESSAQRRSPEKQADMDQVATFDENHSMQRAASVWADPAPAAATPPAATETTRLTPTLAAYVQAWIRASGQRH